jgi:CubicO group peptidase (beta-lactamase class C family)
MDTRGEKQKRIRIRDKPAMTPGFEWRQCGAREPGNGGMQMWDTDDVTRFVLEKPLVAGSGKEFNYTNGVPTVTGAIIKNAVGGVPYRMRSGAFTQTKKLLPLKLPGSWGFLKGPESPGPFCHQTGSSRSHPIGPDESAMSYPRQRAETW